MSFRSLFIGIDKYRSALISDLCCSARDAQALHGLFGDTFGTGGSVFLTNGQATRAAILDGISELGHQAKPEDVVVIGFSGHGSDSHRLITHDSDPFNLDTTAIHLDELTELFTRIPAGNLILFLDCCFSGSAGAKVFNAPVVTKSPESAEALLSKISGKGRLIFTAGTATQEAIEDRRKGHGLFSFYVIQALRGAGNAVKADSISLLSLVALVTRSVVNGARDMRHEQEPTLKGVVEGDLTFPVLTPGPILEGFFPETGPVKVGPDIDGLVGFGFPEEILEPLKSVIPSLNQLQQDAINVSGVLRNHHVVVSAPTSSGKTLIGELAALHGYTRGERSYMLLPLRALVNDKYDEFVSKYGKFGLRVIRSTGEISDQNDTLLRGKFDIALLTYERFASLALTLPHIMRQVGVVIIDELQMITDLNRGANLEFVLTLLKSQRFVGIEPQVITLSAVIGETNGFENWIGGGLLKSEQRPVPLDEGLVDMSGAFRFIADDGTEKRLDNYVRPEYRKGSSQDIIIPLVAKLVSAGEKVLVFRETKPIVRATATYLQKNLRLPPAAETLNLLPTGDPSVASAQLRECLEAGIAFHNADLDREERQAIETTFRDPNSSLKVLVATTTLAMGVNTPAWSVIIAGLEHPDAPYSVAEYKNMVGRAGRLGFTQKGKSLLVAPTTAEAYKLWTTYVEGEPEPLLSRFADQEPLSMICRVLATAASSKVNGLSEQELIDFIQSSFAAHKKKQLMDAESLSRMIARLLDAGLVEQLDDRYRLTELGKVAGELGIQVESVVRIARALKDLPSEALSGPTLLAAAQTSVELDQVIFPVHKKSVKERARWQGAIRQQNLPPSVQRELQAIDDSNYTARCKRLSSVLMWIDGVALNRLEASLLVHLPASNAAGPIRASAERTRDLLGVAAHIGIFVSRDKDVGLDAEVESLATRLELGIPEDIVWLAGEVKRGLERGDYLNLRRAGLTSVEVIEAVDESYLLEVIGSENKVRSVRDALEALKEAKSADVEDLPMPKPAT